MLRRATLLFVLHLVAIMFMAFGYSRVAVSGEWPIRMYDSGSPSSIESGTLPPQLHLEPYGKSTRRFHRPYYLGSRLDWCAGPGARGCGPAAAYAYCNALGYHRPVSIVQERRIGDLSNTRQIGTDQLCSGPHCAGFLSITCTRNV